MHAQLAAGQLWPFLTSELLDEATFLPGDGLFLLHRCLHSHTFANNIGYVGCCTAAAARGGDEHRRHDHGGN